MSKKKDTSDLRREFVALVTDGESIDGYGVRCKTCGHPTDRSTGRKEKFLRLGKAILCELGRLIGAASGSVKVNRAGIAVSGDVYLKIPELLICLSHWPMRPAYGDFYFRVPPDGPNVWCRWEELLDLETLSKKILRREDVVYEGAP